MGDPAKEETTPSLKITAFGSDPGAAMPELADATIALLDAVAVEMYGPEVAAKIAWRVGSTAWRCDLCGVEADERPADWENDGRYDYCAACSRERGRKSA